MKMAAKKQCEGTMCPAGCCPEVDWYCCPDNMYCAATAADCPFVAKKEKLMKMAAKKQCGPNETSCPAGCCPNANWYCCPDNIYCAATAADCPFVAKKEKLMKMAAKKQCGPNETSCPAGCCPNANWYCCPDNIYCAATAADRPFVAKLDVAPMPTGTAALTTSTVLPLLLTVPLLPRRRSSWRWLPRSNVDLMRPLAQLDVAPMPTGTAALTTSTVLPLLLTAPLLPRRRSS